MAICNSNDLGNKQKNPSIVFSFFLHAGQELVLLIGTVLRQKEKPKLPSNGTQAAMWTQQNIIIVFLKICSLYFSNFLYDNE